MYRKLCLFNIVLIFTVANIYADDPSPPPWQQRFRGRALSLDISARVLEQEQVVIWNESHRRFTIPGNPVGLKLVGSNLVVAVQFTPFIRMRGGNILVAQGQIWIDVPDEGIRYHTSIQTIPLDFNEPIYFFPLGPVRDLDKAFIEIMLIIKPYGESESAEAAAEQNE
ncbi:MAG: hypothetical protein FWG99_02040 [Treponema sp.]|nr:hypothetical protein [Treponema sp.]